MYASKLAFAVKAGGKVLREQGDVVYVPFGSEYSLFIKNLNSVRAQVRIEIDGKDIADGDEFVIQPGASMELERFLKNGNKQRGNRFKFIERTAGVEAHRGGIQVEDGFIRIEYEFEREKVPEIDYYKQWYPRPWPKPYYPYYWGDTWYGGCSNTGGSRGLSGDSVPVGSSTVTLNSANASFTCNAASASSASYSAEAATPTMDSFVATDLKAPANHEKLVRSRSLNKAANEAGITAAGSISEQKFTTVSGIYGDGVKHSMVIRLLGAVGEKPVTKPVTVSTKLKCTSCGRVNKSSSKFCADCGTSLEIV